MIALRHYARVSELRELLREPVDGTRAQRIFMLPSHANDEALLDLLRRNESYFGEHPQIWSWSELYRALVPKARLRRQIDPPDHRLILRYILNETLADFDARGVSVPGGVRRRGFLDLLSAAVRELLLEDVTPDRLICDRAEEGLDDAAESKELLYRLYVDYLFYLEERGLADNAQLPSLARADLDEDEARASLCGAELCWIGFLSFTGAQRKLIHAIDNLAPTMHFLVPDAGMSGFRDASLQLGFTIRDATRFGGEIAAITGRDVYAQYDGVAREIASMLEGEGALVGAFEGFSEASFKRSDVGILVASGRANLMASALRRHRVPFQVRTETPVHDTAALEIARMAWEAHRAGWPLKRTLALLSSPVFGLDGLDGEQAFSLMPEGAAAWTAFLADDALAADVFAKLLAFCRYVAEPAGHTGAELLRALLELVADDWIARLSDEARENFDLDFSVRALASARLEIEQKLDLLAELTPPLGEAGSLRFSGADAISFLTDWSKEASTALPPLQKGVVTVYDAPPSVLVSHAFWVMTDVDSGRYPGSTSDQALLGGEIRERVNLAGEDFVHLPTLHEKREQQEALFRRLLCIGEVGTLLSRSILDAQGREQGESPFVESLFSDPATPWWLCAEIKTPPLDGSSASRLYRGPFPRTVSTERCGKHRVSASAVDEWYECPYRYWLDRVARVGARMDEVEMFDRAVRGNIVHGVWQAVWTRFSRGGGTTLHATLLGGWDEYMVFLARRYPFLADERAAPVRADLRGMMLDMAELQDEVEARAAAIGLVRAEAKLEYRLPELEMEHAVFAGLADRLDIWKGVGAVVVDYKLGSTSAYKDALQLACYAAMLRDAEIGPVVGFCYMGHGDGKIRGSWALEELKGVYDDKSRFDAPFAEKVDGAYSVMQDMDAVLGGGKFTANYESKLCTHCDYAQICRRTERFGVFSGGEEGADDDTDE
ncbi:PD-(D/E)XK nuclease family protein [Synergistaceae bacterium OttesenSCG-928-I11]|nr:PD-(D/E)XK nuclease family protein [Synergistaceae bacterium OttesenSCG-928-I11]